MRDQVAKRKLFEKAFEQASGNDPIKAGKEFFGAVNEQGVFEEEKDEIAKKIKNLGSKFGIKNLKQSEESPTNNVLEEVSIGNVEKNNNNKVQNPLDLTVNLDKVGIKKNFNIGENFEGGLKVDQTFGGDTEYGLEGSGFIFPGVRLNVDLTNKDQLMNMGFNRKF